LQIWQASVLDLSRLTVLLCRNTTVLPQSLVLAQHSRINTLVQGAVLMQLWGRKIEVEETASHKFLFLPSDFAPPARAMPAIP